MKKGKERFSLTRAIGLWCQHIITLLPYILIAIAVGSILNVAFRRTSTISYGHIRQQMESVQKIWNIAKDPDSRRGASSSSNDDKTSNSDDYDYLAKEIPKEPILIPETWKEPGLLNLDDFQWIMNNKSICAADPEAPKDTRIVPVLIHTFRDHFDQREVVRKSWGSIPIYKKWDVRLIFLLGVSNNYANDDGEDNESSSDYQQSDGDGDVQKLEEEQEKYGDLVMGNFLDNPKNLTYKHMMGYKWVLNYCENATFVMKAEEDKFVDIIRWLDWRTQDMETLEKMKTADNVDEETGGDEQQVPDLYCNMFSGGSPIREEGSNYYSSQEDWPESYFPDYCSSWAYGTTVDLMKKQYAVSAERKFFWIDDVYFGALLELVQSKFEWKPVVKDCFKTHMGKKELYRQICEYDGTTHFDKTKEFGPVVHVEQGDTFEQDMMCLWNKTLHDTDYKFDTKS